MSPKRVKELLPVMQAYAEGKQVQGRHPDEVEWRDLPDPSFNSQEMLYRVKPEPEKSIPYRRFLVRQSSGHVMVCITWASKDSDAPQPKHSGFIAWIDTEWQTHEVPEQA